MSSHGLPRDDIPYFNIGGEGDGYVVFEDNVNVMCSNICDSEYLARGMMFQTKEDLIIVVKSSHIRRHCNFCVEESKKNLWTAYCMKRDQGCSWRRRACKKKLEGIFVICPMPLI